MKQKKAAITPPSPKLSQPAKGSLVFITELFIGTMVIMASLFLFSYLGSHVIDKQVFWFDISIFRLLYPLRNPLLTNSMFGITFLGSGTFLTIAAVGVIGYLYWKNHKRTSLTFLFLLLSGTELNFLLKNIFHRARPEFYPLVNEPSYSFPSGHAMNSFIFYTALSFFIFNRLQNKRLKPVLILISAILILLIGLSRIYLGAHYPSDVLAGFIAGLLWFAVIVVFEKTLVFLELFKKSGKALL
jgi:undecaprenyl-diphosphatase